MRCLSCATIAVCTIFFNTSSVKRFSEVAEEVKSSFVDAERELAEARQQILEVKRAASKKLTRLESEALVMRRLDDEAASAFANKKAESKSLEDRVETLKQEYGAQKAILSSYVAQFSGGVSLAEFDRYREQTDTAQSIASDKAAAPSDVLSAQLEVIESSLGRIRNLLGGARIAGLASGGGDTQVAGEYILAGPLTFFSDGNAMVGIGLERTNKAYPVIYNTGFPKETLAQIASVATTGSGLIPIDPTNGDAIAIREAQDGFLEHIVKGGITMIPLVGLFFVAAIVTLIKAFEIGWLKVAIPCLVAHVMLSRFAKSKLDRMERISVTFVNGLHVDEPVERGAL